MKKFIPLTLALLLAFAGTVSAETLNRNETVYVNLDTAGKPQTVEVVTWLKTDGQAPSRDAARLQQVKNVRALEKPQVYGNDITFVQGDRNIFYRGTTDKALPVTVAIAYKLNGRSISFDDLQGKSGDLEMQIFLTNETSRPTNLTYTEVGSRQKRTVREDVNVPFVVQVQTTLDIDHFSDVDAPEGVFAVLGNAIHMSWIVLPRPDETITLKARVTDVAIPSIMLTAVPKMIELPEVDIEESLNKIYDGVDEVGGNLDKLYDGSLKIHDGHRDLVDGTEKMDEGVGKLLEASEAQADMVRGAMEINDVIMGKVQPAHFLPPFNQMLDALGVENELLGLVADRGPFSDTVVDFLHDNDKEVPEDIDEFPGIGVTTEGIRKLQDEGIGELLDGAHKLYDGSDELSVNLKRLKLEGTEEIKKGIVEGAEDLVLMLARLDAAKDLADEYDRYAGEPSDVSSSVQFIMKTPGAVTQ